MSIRRQCRVWFCGLAVLAGLGSGCRLFKGEGGSNGTRDPLFGRDRIPATDLPTTGRENARGRPDPLLVPPGKDDDRLSSDLPAGDRRDPFRTGPNTTAAGLARGKSDPLMSVRADEPIDDRRPRGGPVYLQDTRNASTLERTIDELKRLGVTVGEPLREGDEFILRGERVDQSIRRRYEGAGRSAAAAAQDLLEQVRSEGSR
ncbi:MAG: hypothetical protein KF873_04790 [Gemmataceae bacterium]|nr:hypothetical protein [Gemmataceae bacterium]